MRFNPACRFGSISVISTIGCGVFPSLSCLVSGAFGVELNGTGKVSSACRMRQTVSLNLLHLVSLCPHWRAMAPLQWALIWEITLYPAGSRGNVEEHIKSSLWIRLCALLWGQVMGGKSISRGLWLYSFTFSLSLYLSLSHCQLECSVIVASVYLLIPQLCYSLVAVYHMDSDSPKGVIPWTYYHY